MSVHLVQQGDRLSSIAQAYGVSPAAVLHANPTKPRVRTLGGAEVFASLSVGETLFMPETDEDLFSTKQPLDSMRPPPHTFVPLEGEEAMQSRSAKARAKKTAARATLQSDLGWPWSDCPPSGGFKNTTSPGCTPLSSDPNTEDPLGRWYLLGGRIGIDAEERDTVVNAVPVRAWVCAKPCWTGDTCDCQAVGICDGGGCGAITATPVDPSDPPAELPQFSQGGGSTPDPTTPPSPPPVPSDPSAPPANALTPVLPGYCTFAGYDTTCSSLPYWWAGAAALTVGVLGTALYIATRGGSK